MAVMVKTQEKNIDLVWENYKKTNLIEDKKELILNYIWLVKYVLQNMNLPNNSILSEEDFLNIGILGLHESIERYERERGVKFESYAIPRIKGIIQDELRKLDWLSRTARKKAHDLIEAGDKLRMQVGRDVSSEEIRLKLELSPEEYQSYLAAAAAAKASLSLSESTQAQLDDGEKNFLDEIPDPAHVSTLNILENEERIKFLTDYLKELNERKRLIMTLYYYESLTFKEIGKILSVSESRICQIHSQVISDLKEKLEEFDNA
jgi:RNA polymerase sigma factor for flagellar operon FliA